MKIVFCTTCKNRDAHLIQTLPGNMAGNPRSQFVVLDYGSDANLFDLETRVAAGAVAVGTRASLDFDRLSVYRYETDEPFHMTHAKNMAHRLGMLEGADVLVNVDADNYLFEGFEDFIEEHFRPDTFLWAGMVRGLGRQFRGVGGRIAVTPNAFIKTGGYDETYTTWARDDKDFNERLCFLGYRPVEIDRKFLRAIPHGDGVRFREYPHVREAANGEDSPAPPPTTAVRNFGKIGVGHVHRADGSGGRLEPMPTRIFGIGLHKTCTTSLSSALQILGYESGHWESGPWARSIWGEVLANGVSPTLEKFYALSDLPISIIYKELDRAYPGSKFILTTRSEAEWLRSVKDHFSWKNPYRWEWEKYPFSNRIHTAVYGRKDFDADTFLTRYRRHNAEVIEYFKNRPDDLLVMPYPRWDDLCRFLRKAVPSVEYPRQFVTRGDAND